MALQIPDLELIEAARFIISPTFIMSEQHFGHKVVKFSQPCTSKPMWVELQYVRKLSRWEMAAATGDTNVESIVAVDRNGNVVSPCGMCRELISDYSPDARVIVPGKRSAEVLSIRDLLPLKYIRNKTSHGLRPD
jgi:cytidine deaminase